MISIDDYPRDRHEKHTIEYVFYQDHLILNFQKAKKRKRLLTRRWMKGIKRLPKNYITSAREKCFNTGYGLPWQTRALSYWTNDIVRKVSIKGKSLDQAAAPWASHICADRGDMDRRKRSWP